MKSPAGKILITGSSGMLGIDLTSELKRKYDVIGTDLIRKPQSGVESFYKADIIDRKAISDIVRKVSPDITIHTAAWTDVDGCENDRNKAYVINTEGAGNVAMACGSASSRMIYISTDFVFDGKKRRPYRESDKPNPLSVYADSKLKGELAVAGSLKEHFILRTGWLYGKNGKNFVDTIIKKSKSDGLVKVVDDQVGSPTYTVDLAKAIKALIDRIFIMLPEHQDAGYGIYHVSNSGRVSWYRYAKAILRLRKIKAKVIPISSEELARPASRPAMSVLNNSKFKKFTGHRMRAWKNALGEYLNQ